MHFSCIGTGTNILYLINDLPAFNFIMKGFKESNKEMVGSLIRKNLTIMSATLDLNNTNIQCRTEVAALPPNPSVTALSNTSTLKIQG